MDKQVTPEPVLIASHISITYSVRAQRHAESLSQQVLAQVVGKKSSVLAVKDVSFEIHRGESVGLVGSNGSGKSSIIRVLAGLQRPSSGVVWARSTPAMLSVSSLMMPTLSGARNIRLGLLAKGFTPDQVSEMYPKIVEFSGLREHIHFPVKSYSSGMQARLKFAIATSTMPDILLVDEALGTGDASFREKSEAKLNEVREAAGAIMIVNHNAKAIADQCNRVLWLEQGELRDDGAPEVILPAYREYLINRRK